VTAPVVRSPEDRAAASLVARSALRALAFTFGIAAVVAGAAPFVIPMLFGHDFDGAVTPLELLLPGVVAYAPVNVLVVYLSIRRERPRLSLLVSVVGMLMTLAGALALVPGHGASGAAAGSSIGYAAAVLVAWALFVRLSRARRASPSPAV
jgi:O-antigen/teichoic acid export membrane protein